MEHPSRKTGQDGNKVTVLTLDRETIMSQQKFSCWLINHGGVLKTQIKEIIPQHELPQYFLELAIWKKKDLFKSLKKIFSVREIAHKQSDVNSSGSTETCTLWMNQDLSSQPNRRNLMKIILKHFHQEMTTSLNTLQIKNWWRHKATFQIFCQKGKKT